MKRSKKPLKKSPEPAVRPTTITPRAEPTDEQIRTRAFEIFQKRGGGQGHAWDDWITAERELRGS
jgi:hypothetical protein